jgi:hypothetical protein
MLIKSFEPFESYQGLLRLRRLTTVQQKVLPRFLLKHVETFLRSFRDFFKIFSRFFQDFFEIFSRFFWDFFKIFLRFFRDFFEIFLRFFRDFFKISDKTKMQVSRPKFYPLETDPRSITKSLNQNKPMLFNETYLDWSLKTKMYVGVETNILPCHHGLNMYHSTVKMSLP